MTKNRRWCHALALSLVVCAVLFLPEPAFARDGHDVVDPTNGNQGRLLLSLKGGIASDLGQLDGPALQFETTRRTGLLGGRLAVGLEIGARAAIVQRRVVFALPGEITRTRVLAVPVQARLAFLEEVTDLFLLSAHLGVGAAWAWHDHAPASWGPSAHSHLVPVFHFGMGMGYRLGLGEVVLDGRYQWLSVPTQIKEPRVSDTIPDPDGRIDRIMLSFGYRIAL